MAPVTNLGPRQNGTPENCPGTISGGAIAGIVIGTIAGTLLLVWLFYLCRLPGAWGGASEPDHITIAQSPRGRRGRRYGSAVGYTEKPTSSRRYRSEVRRPAKVYV